MISWVHVTHTDHDETLPHWRTNLWRFTTPPDPPNPVTPQDASVSSTQAWWYNAYIQLDQLYPLGKSAHFHNNYVDYVDVSHYHQLRPKLFFSWGTQSLACAYTHSTQVTTQAHLKGIQLPIRRRWLHFVTV